MADAPLAELIGGGGGNPTMQTVFANGDTTAIFSDKLRKVVLCRDLTHCLPLIPANDDTIFVLPDVVGNIVKELGRHLSYQSRYSHRCSSRGSDYKDPPKHCFQDPPSILFMTPPGESP